MKEINYHDKQNINNINKLRELENSLPAFVKSFFRGIEPITQSRTRIAYAEDLKVFFEFVRENNPEFKDKEFSAMRDPTVLERFKAEDIEEFLDYLKLYENSEGKTYTNSEAGIKRKISSLRAMYNYYHTHQIINENPTLQVRVPKIHEKNIIRMDPNEVVDFLDTVETGKNLSKKSLEFHEKNKVRDLAITTLLLGTGIRVSECVGLDLKDLDMENDRINIIRKGGNESFVYFGDEVHEALIDYLEERKKIIPESGSENALFLSSRKKRMCVRNVEFMVKKYAKLSVSSKKITPHKLRSTYGTQLYTETGDIYLVAEVLGHKDVNTTKRHYAAIDEERRRSAKDAVKLREK